MEATLQQILDSRERRAARQQQLLDQYKKPLLCFTMNIPGPIKWSREISVGFFVGKLLLKDTLPTPVHFEEHQDDAGCEAFYVMDLPARKLKRMVLELEEIDPIGRLFDMDVLNADGSKLSREQLGFPQRKCLICQEIAWNCSRSRRHNLAQLQEKTAALLSLAATQWLAEYIAAKAYAALLQEVMTTPKPGLVDQNNCGAHKDMHLQHFFLSANALRPYFCRFAETGYLTRELSGPEALQAIRPIGIQAEQAMLSATGGVNTHKGAIFSLGLLCCAAGRLPPHLWSPETLLIECAYLTAGITDRELKPLTETLAHTAGERQYLAWGLTGIRGEAEAGFPSVANIGLPVFRRALRQGCSANDAGCFALLHIMAGTDDSNLIHRSSRQRQLQLRGQLTELLAQDPFPPMDVITQLDRDFIRENLSPGGSADLLSVTLFLANL